MESLDIEFDFTPFLHILYDFVANVNNSTSLTTFQDKKESKDYLKTGAIFFTSNQPPYFQSLRMLHVLWKQTQYRRFACSIAQRCWHYLHSLAYAIHLLLVFAAAIVP
jgi:hypothetical protein